MDEYKWYKDDFESNPTQNSSYNTDSENSYADSANSQSANSSSAEYGSDSYYSAQEQDFDYSQSENSSNNNGCYYNSTVHARRPKKKVPLYTTILAVVLTAALTVSGAVVIPRISRSVKSKTPASGSTAGAAIVTASATDTANKKALSTPEIVDKVGPAVVGIINKATLKSYGNIFDFYYGNGNQQQGKEVEQSSGSGVVISADGYIVTNNHVIDGAEELVVILNTGEEYTAKLIGKDSRTDIAILKIDVDCLTFATLGNSSELRVGDTAIAIGNPLGQEFAGTTTQGIISGLNRTVNIENRQLTLIQTDAAINPGNSGGALVNAYGELIGINTAKISSSTLEGLGFAIPIDVAKPVIKELIDNGYVTGRPIIGIGGRSVTEQDAQAYNLKVGVYVTSMTENSPAHMAGIKIGDIIVACNGEAVKTVEEINKIKNKFAPGDKLKLKIYRQGQYIEVNIILGEESPFNQ